MGSVVVTSSRSYRSLGQKLECGVVEGLEWWKGWLQKERRLPPPECLRVWVGGVVDEGDGRETILREKKTRLASVMF